MNSSDKFIRNRKGQIALFVIIAIVIVALIVLFFVFKDKIFAENISAELKPVFDYYDSCIKEEAKAALDLAGSQGGRIDSNVYISGSSYAPFSSQLNFLGFPVSYWYYVSGNGITKENVPTKAEMEDDISRYIEEMVNVDCNFDDFYKKGFVIQTGIIEVKTTIEDNKVIINSDMDLAVSKEEDSARRTSKSLEVNSNFGKMYNTALSIYNKEKRDAFLENYSVDVLRTYVPVDGVEVSCSGKIWKTREVIDNLKNALEANIAAIKFKGNYYSTSTKSDKKYFVVDLPVEQQVSLIYSKIWPTKVEIAGANNELMIAPPVGTQRGTNMMGFCYAPYHFVYDISYPVLMQILDGTEIFQFPVVVVIDKNLPRQGESSLIQAETPAVDICQYNTKNVKIILSDSGLNAADANLSYECFNQECDLGESKNGLFEGKVPSCYNGYLKAKSDNYAEKMQLFSSNEESFSEIILDNNYNVQLNLEVGGNSFNGEAMISFGGENSVSTFLPDEPSIKISQGLYNITVYAYGNSPITIPASTKKQCTEVSKGGILGYFGATRKECFDITLPEEKIDSVLVGGGRSELYILPSDLEKGKLTIKVDSLPTPKSIDDLQTNFVAVDTMGVAL